MTIAIRPITRSDSISIRRNFIHALNTNCLDPPFEDATRTIYNVLYGLTYEQVRSAHGLNPDGTRYLRDVLGPGGLQAIALTEELAAERLNQGSWISANDAMDLVAQAAMDVLNELESNL
jgi:hypothetical protein